MLEAIEKRSEHVLAFLVFTSAFSDNMVSGWTDLVRAWEADNLKINPFASTVPSGPFVIKNMQSCIDAPTAKYNNIRKALVVISPWVPMVDWEQVLQPLLVSDLRGILAAEDDLPEQDQVMSWIWTTLEGNNTLVGDGKHEGASQYTVCMKLD
ncbi:hypothetical protein H0H81_010419 [Sphagnurus paluster]|uniref:Uncharacterized protein n=1 Tax=Sphagnurus paluster TaxID=117069 RepID=A0A9P7K2J8_9AGAR|nr:hypothetical protein H0H81_010419 [Sphagnurus paluster]